MWGRSYSGGPKTKVECVKVPKDKVAWLLGLKDHVYLGGIVVEVD